MNMRRCILRRFAVWGMPAVVLPLALAASASAEDTAPIPVDRALENVEQDIADTRERLRRERKQIANRREEMAATIKELEAKVRELRTRRNDQNAQLKEVRATIEETGARADDAEERVDFSASLMTEHRRNLGTRLSAPASFLLQSSLADIDARLNVESPRERLDAVPPLLELSLQQAARGFGGQTIREQALTTAGRTEPGTFMDFGPFRYFVPDDPERPAGLARQLPNAERPTVFAKFATRNAGEAIRRLERTGEAEVPVDLTGGDAVRLAAAKPTWSEHLAQGGFVIIPLLALAGVCLVLAVYKFIALARIQLKDPEGRIRTILDQLESRGEQTALEAARRLRPPLRAVIEEGIRHRDAPKESLEEILYERLIAQTPRLESLLTPLAVCASTAPLLGLLGTVTGMIHTFRLITVHGTGDAGVLSSGISEALVTTEVGLAIAIPALLIHAFLSRRVTRATANSQRAAITFVNGLTVRLHQNSSTQ
ncbi:MAG: MotA/TolQ/ExbB proton channel family protein [Verrucomicrobiota bacterium]